MKMQEVEFVKNFEAGRKQTARSTETEKVGEFVHKTYRYVSHNPRGDEYRLDTYSHEDGSLWYASTYGVNPCFIGTEYGDKREFHEWHATV